jgi:hypothetical protein
VTRRGPGAPARTTARGVNARSERESFRSGSIVTRTSKCKECGGSRLCPHQRERSRFKGAVPVNEVDTRGHRERCRPFHLTMPPPSVFVLCVVCICVRAPVSFPLCESLTIPPPSPLWTLLAPGTDYSAGDRHLSAYAVFAGAYRYIHIWEDPREVEENAHLRHCSFRRLVI